MEISRRTPKVRPICPDCNSDMRLEIDEPMGQSWACRCGCVWDESFTDSVKDVRNGMGTGNGTVYPPSVGGIE